MNTTYTVQPAAYVTIANAIHLNCDEHVAGRIDRETWHANQLALWAEAERQHVMADVMRLVCPSLGKKR